MALTMVAPGDRAARSEEVWRLFGVLGAATPGCYMTYGYVLQPWPSCLRVVLDSARLLFG